PPARALARRRADRQSRPPHRPDRGPAAAGHAARGKHDAHRGDAQPGIGQGLAAAAGNGGRNARGVEAVTFLRLLLRNLVYHRRGNGAVLLGVALGTAVLTGALLVGDSLRGSLRSLALDQLGWVDEALVTGRFFRQALAEGVGAG